MLRRQYELDDVALDELIEELVEVQRVARREENVRRTATASSRASRRCSPALPPRREETFFVIRRVLTTLGQDKPG